jgi:hypothetical protein
MPSTADGSKNPVLRGGSDRILHITHVGTARDKARFASCHSVPDHTRIFVAVIAGTQQIAFESPVK